MSRLPDRLTLAVLTGFLGSGKTTLLKRLLAHPEMERTAIIVNEFGEIGLDDALFQQVDEQVVLMDSGCLCCTIRNDLISTIVDLMRRAEAGEVPAFSRVVIETTGLADPAPILHTLMTHPLVLNRFRLDAVITTVDATQGVEALERHPEGWRQAGLADRLVLTKTDMQEATGKAEPLRAHLSKLNPATPILPPEEAVPSALFGAGLYDPAKRLPDAVRWLNLDAYGGETDNDKSDSSHRSDHRHRDEHGHNHHDHHHDVNRHGRDIQAHAFTVDARCTWENLADAMEEITLALGQNLLRLKGIAWVEESDQPVVLHAVGHVFHPPLLLDEWPKRWVDQPGTRIVAICQSVSPMEVERLFRRHALPITAGSQYA